MGRCSILLASIAVASHIPLAAQSGRGAAPSARVVKLALQDDAALEDGRIAIVEGVADARGLRYSLPGISILQPVAVTLLSPEENPSLEISLHPSRWEEAVRAVRLEGRMARTLKFRHQGAVGIKVRSLDGRPQRFDLLAWVGTEITPEVENVVVSPERYTAYAAANPKVYPAGAPPADGGRGTSPVLILIAVLLAGILGLLAILVFKRVRS